MTDTLFILFNETSCYKKQQMAYQDIQFEFNAPQFYDMTSGYEDHADSWFDSQTEDRHDPNYREVVVEPEESPEEETFYSMAPSQPGSADNSVVNATEINEIGSNQIDVNSSEASDEPGLPVVCQCFPLSTNLFFLSISAVF